MEAEIHDDFVDEGGPEAWRFGVTLEGFVYFDSVFWGNGWASFTPPPAVELLVE